MLQLIQEYISKLTEVDKQLEKLMTDRKIIETELSALTTAIKNQSEVFGKIISLSHDCAFILDGHSRFTYASISGAQLFGLKQLDVIGKNWRELGLPREIMIPFEAHLKTVFLLGTSMSKVAKVAFPHGIRYLEYFLNPIFGRNHVVAAVFCVARDVTQNKESETIQQQLTLQYINEAQRLQQLIDTAPLAILTVDSEGFITAINNTAIQLLPQIYNRFKSSQVHQMSMAIQEDYADDLLIARALQGEEINSRLCQRGEKCFLASVHPTREPSSGKIIGAVAFYQDITELEQLRKELARLDRLNLIGEMAAGVAHEIRNPMTVVMGYIQMLAAKAEDEQREKYAIIMEELNCINTIVTDFLSLAKNKAVVKEEQNINSIINSIVPLLQADAAKHDIEVVLNLEEAMPMLLLNEKEMKQLILNLSRNAIEAMTAKGKLYIKTKVRPDKVELITIDNGCGIDQEYMSKIFDPFFTTKDCGTGLGLAVCYSIVERHGGKIDLKSTVGAGTTFTISFPRIEGERPGKVSISTDTDKWLETMLD